MGRVLRDGQTLKVVSEGAWGREDSFGGDVEFEVGSTIDVADDFLDYDGPQKSILVKSPNHKGFSYLVDAKDFDKLELVE